jgi:hypothetical protein
MHASTLYIALFLGLVALAFAGLYLYTWRHRRDAMPKVPPLPPDDEDEWGKPPAKGQPASKR